MSTNLPRIVLNGAGFSTNDDLEAANYSQDNVPRTLFVSRGSDDDSASILHSLLSLSEEILAPATPTRLELTGHQGEDDLPVPEPPHLQTHSLLVGLEIPASIHDPTAAFPVLDILPASSAASLSVPHALPAPAIPLAVFPPPRATKMKFFTRALRYVKRQYRHLLHRLARKFASRVSSGSTISPDVLTFTEHQRRRTLTQDIVPTSTRFATPSQMTWGLSGESSRLRNGIPPLGEITIGPMDQVSIPLQYLQPSAVPVPPCSMPRSRLSRSDVAVMADGFRNEHAMVFGTVDAPVGHGGQYASSQSQGMRDSGEFVDIDLGPPGMYRRPLSTIAEHSEVNLSFVDLGNPVIRNFF